MEDLVMTTINVSNFRKNLFNILEQTIQFNEPVTVTTKEGSAVVMSEEDYKALMETVYVSSPPKMKRKIQSGLDTEIEDCVAENRVDYNV